MMRFVYRRDGQVCVSNEYRSVEQFLIHAGRLLDTPGAYIACQARDGDAIRAALRRLS